MAGMDFPTPGVSIESVTPGELKERIDGESVASIDVPSFEFLEEGDDGAPEGARQLYETLQERVIVFLDDALTGSAHYSDATSQELLAGD